MWPFSELTHIFMQDMIELQEGARGSLENWRMAHQGEIEAITSQIEDPATKAIVIEGAVHSGKTTLAIVVSQKMERNGVDTYFTTPAVQQTLTSIPVQDRTGVRFTRLPSPSSIREKGKPALIIIDETGGHKPEAIGQWGKYVKLSRVQFIILTTPGSTHLDEWRNLFDSEQISFHRLV